MKATSAESRPDGTLRWSAPSRLGSNLYALARSAGFKWQKGAKHWKAKDTPEARRFLKEQGCEIREVPAPPFTTTPKARTLPELTDFRLTRGKRWAILFVQQGEVHYTKRLDLRRPGAGPVALHADGHTAVFVREVKVRPESEEQPFERLVWVNPFVLRATPEVCELLAQVFWGRTLNPQESVQPAHLDNAAD